MSEFSLGQLVMSRSVNDNVADDTQFAIEVTEALGRYVRCDWGDMAQEDKEQNDIAVKSGEQRIFAAYQTSKGKIWIITEWDRSCTTVLFPHEY